MMSWIELFTFCLTGILNESMTGVNFTWTLNVYYFNTFDMFKEF